MDRKNEILQAASNVFERYGLAKSTLDDIARECGIKKTALYYYFKNKEELFKEMFVHDIENVKNLVVEAVEKKDNPIDKIKTYMISRLNSLDKMQKYFTIFQKDDAAVTYRNFAYKIKEKVIHQEIEFLKNVISEGVQKDIFQVEYVNSLAIMLMGATYGLTHEIFCFGNKINLEKEVDKMMEIILKGIEK